MKSILLVLLFFLAPVAMAGEFRIFGMQRFGEAVYWSEYTDKFPKVIPSLSQTGNLTIAQLKLINNVGPYDHAQGRAVSRPALLDDLHYESLLLEDPVDGTERMYPLLAKALRVPADWSYVVFELNPAARFQDGSPITAADIEFSYQLYAQSALAAPTAAKVIQMSSASGELRFDLNVTGQAARDVIMALARMKIVKPNPSKVKILGGVAVNHIGTGPYRITQLGQARLALIKNPFYWANALNTRKGFFNFRRVEVLAFDESENARRSLNEKVSNFYLEPQPTVVPQLADELLKAGVPVQLIQENLPSAGMPLQTFRFNIQSPAVSDRRVRQAILLTYDFNHINQLMFGGHLKRPTSFLDESRISVIGLPSSAVRVKMQFCELPPEAMQTFESYGNSQYAQLGDRRLRLLTAMRLLQEAGYRLVDGKQVKELPSGELQPLVVRALTTADQSHLMNVLRGELAGLGITLEVSLAANQDELKTEQRLNMYDLVSRDEHVVTRDRWPRLDLTEDLFHPLAMPCLENLLSTLRTGSPMSESYRATAEALARIQQVLALNIYIGQPRAKNFFLDQRIQVPAGLSVEKAHLYGYWRGDTLP